MKRSIRVISLLLAVLLIALPPLQARAAIGTGTGILIGLAATAVIGSVMAGLGIMPGSDRSVFDGLVDDCIASDAVSPFLDGDGLIQVLRYANLTGGIRYGVLQNLIEAVRGWLFRKDVVQISGAHFISANTFFYTSADQTKWIKFSKDVYMVPIKGDGSINFPSYKVFYISYDGSFTVTQDWTSSSTSTAYGPFSYYAISYGTAASYLEPLYPCLYDNSSTLFLNNKLLSMISDGSILISSSVVSSYDISLGEVETEDEELSTAYSDWSAGSIALPHPGIDIPGVDEGTDEGTGEDTGEEEGEEEDEKKLVYWPTGIGGSLTDVGSDATTGALTQEGVISGVGTLDDTLTGALPGTIVGGLTGDVAIDTTVPGEGTEEGEGTGEGTITYPTEIGSYALDLTDFFPFCIPFDIVDFLTLLAAEPEAPRFEFDINFPYMDEPWHVVIDLSAWDSIAALLRTLELLAFIIGLAVVTREKFLRG